MRLFSMEMNAVANVVYGVVYFYTYKLLSGGIKRIVFLFFAFLQMYPVTVTLFLTHLSLISS